MPGPLSQLQQFQNAGQNGFFYYHHHSSGDNAWVSPFLLLACAFLFALLHSERRYRALLERVDRRA